MKLADFTRKHGLTQSQEDALAFHLAISGHYDPETDEVSLSESEIAYEQRRGADELVSRPSKEAGRIRNGEC